MKRLAFLILGILMQASIGISAAPSIIPLPLQMQTRPGAFTLCGSSQSPARATRKIVVDDASLQTGQYLSMMLSRSTGSLFPIVNNNSAGPIHNAILLTTSNAIASLGNEGYELTVAPDSVVIRAPNQAGMFYGVQSLLQLFPAEIMSPQPTNGIAWTAPCIYIQDQPRFQWRGMMLDVSRHFMDKQEIEHLMDGLALFKMNSFHWHLADDHGWRIEIKSYPLLTATASTNTGAWRTGIDYGQNPTASTAWNSLGKYGGYYTQDDIREVVSYAQQRHINIVPEIEFPAHCSAALISYPSLGCGHPASVYNMDNINYNYTLFSLAGPGCWTFFTNVLTEVMDLFPGQYIHCGGDEVVATGDKHWTNYVYDVNQMNALGINPAGGNGTIRSYQHYLSTNLNAFLQSNSRTFCGWSEIEAAGTVTNAVLFDWLQGATNYAQTTASNHQYVVMAPNGINQGEMNTTNTKLFEPYISGGTNTVANVYNYEPIPANLDSAYTNYILGAQVNLWTEFVPSPLNAEYKAFPRVCAEAETTWTSKALKNYTDFTNRLVAAEQRLTELGLNYNHENITEIGTWGPSVPTNATTFTYDITPNVTKAGQIDVSFAYTSGSDGINVFSVALLENGTQIDFNTFTSFAGAGVYTQTGNKLGGLAYYILQLPGFHPGSTYTLEVSMAENGAKASSNGKVFLPNWN